MNAHVIEFYKERHRHDPFETGWWLAYPDLLAARKRRWCQL